MKKKRKPSSTRATCHPNRPHMARGLYKKCYDKDYSKRNKHKTDKIKTNWRKNNPDKISEVRRRYLYGMEPEDYQKLLIAHNKRCAICKKKTKLHVDHNHKTGRVRGLLCGSCNRGLGILKDSLKIIKSAERYLRKYK